MKQLFPLAVLVLGGVLGSIFLGDYINLDSLRDNQASLLSYRQEHPVLMAASFLSIYFAIVSFSLPGAAVASLVGGFFVWLVAWHTLKCDCGDTGGYYHLYGNQTGIWYSTCRAN